jgi:CBS domain-containing protein
MTASEILMTPAPVTCSEHDSANQAARLMWEHDVGALPVVDEHGRLCGMITDRDICMAAYTQGKPLAGITVGSAMSHDVACVGPRDDASRVEALMRHHQVRRVPVVDESMHPLGIISLNDLARRSDPARGAIVSEHEIAATLRAVCTPHELPVAAAASSRSVTPTPSTTARRPSLSAAPR